MKLIILNKEQRDRVDVPGICGIENYRPEKTFRYNIDKAEHIRERLHITPLELLDLVFDLSDIQPDNPHDETGDF
jgi:hypothetical protein